MEVPFSIPQCMARCGVVRQGGLSWPGRTSTRPGTVASVAGCSHVATSQPCPHQPARCYLVLSSEVRWRQGPVLARYFRYLTLQRRSRRHLA